jgi:outer membrane protein assembly factor BamB
MKADRDKKVVAVSAALTGFAACLSLAWWFSYDPTADFVAFVPGMDNPPASAGAASIKENIDIGEFWQTFDGVPADLPGSWPRFRGSNFDNIAAEVSRLANSWSAGGSEIIWSVELGEGHAAPAVLNGRVYVLDYDEEQKGDALRCFSLADGKEIWRRWYKVRTKRNHGISRTIPAVTDRFVVTIGPRCHVMCVDTQSGEFLWGLDLEKDFGTETPFWYTGQCPLIDDEVAVIAPGGKALLIGVDCGTGEILWETPNPKNWQMSHSSIMPMTLSSKKMYVYCAIGGIVAVSAEGENRGQVLWETEVFAPSVIAPSPLQLEDGKVLVTAGYGAGSILLKITKVNDVFSVEKLLQHKPDEGIATEQQTPIFYKGHLFSIQPKDAGALQQQLVCYRADDLRNPVWTSGKTNRFGMGPYLIADNKMFVLSDDGLLTLLELSFTGYKELAKAQVLNGHDAWGPMALAGDRLLLRDSRRMVCLEVGAN